jgi:hypothetical protein
MKLFHLAAAFVLLSAPVVLGGCASGPAIPFTRGSANMDTVPEADLRAVAEAIEAAVRAGEAEPKIANHGAIVADFPTLQQAVRSRALRSNLIDRFLESGHAYETDNGLVAVLRTKEYKSEGTAQDRDRDALLVMSENNNRWTIYEGIVENSKLPQRSLAAVQEIFRQVRQANLKPGQKFQAPGSEIAVK